MTSTNNKVATIETNLNGITQRVSSTESTVSSHTTQLGTVDNRINTAKNSAISTAASDATTKANNAQSKALADAKTYTNGQITTVNQTISNRFSEIKATTDGITQKVSANETKVNSVTTSLNNLQVGGRNLLKDSDFIVQATSSAFAPTKTVTFVNGLDLNVALLGKIATFSYYVHCPGNRTNGSGSLGNRFGIHGSIQ